MTQGETHNVWHETETYQTCKETEDYHPEQGGKSINGNRPSNNRWQNDEIGRKGH